MFIYSEKATKFNALTFLNNIKKRGIKKISSVCGLLRQPQLY